jgi:hypothetical protein
MSQEIEVAKLQTMMEQNSRDHEAIIKMITRIEEKIDAVGKDKANKWVETAFMWLLLAIGTTFIGLIIRWLVLLELK